MEDHLQTKWFFNRGLDSEIPLEYPQHLQGEINYYLNKEVLDLPLFEDLNDNFIKHLGRGILTQFAGPNDCLVYKEDPVNTIWYIKSGSMEVMEDDMVVAILGAGDLVGCDLEDHLLHPNRNVITRSGFLVRALTYCELKAIQLEHLLELYRQYPEMFKTDLNSRILNDLTYNLKCNSIITEQVPTTNLKFHVSDKQTQTDVVDNDFESTNLMANDFDADTISQNSVVKFNFESNPMVTSPIKSPTISNGHINKTILKKNYTSNEILSTNNLERSASLIDSNKEMSPLLGGKHFPQLNKSKQETNRLSRLREKFASKKSSSVDVCSYHSNSLTLDIPEIVLNSPEDENSND